MKYLTVLALLLSSFSLAACGDKSTPGTPPSTCTPGTPGCAK